jgi:hypothetical protein
MVMETEPQTLWDPDQRPYREAGDTPDWGEAPGRAQNMTL